MRRAGHRRVMQVMTWALGCQGLLGTAVAATPFSRVAVDRSPAEEHRSVALRNLSAQRLDLSLPPAVAATGSAGSIGSTGTSPATQVRAAGAGVEDAFSVQPNWRGLAPRLTSLTRIQELVRNERRDGVPLARLWQSRGAALNLGVSPKGKPGLWFVKAIP